MEENSKKKSHTAQDRLVIPAVLLPQFRSTLAIQNNVHRNLLIRTWGGIGDQICAEPTLRHALTSFTDCQISLASELPEMFGHLNFHRVFDLREAKPNYEKYFVFDTITPPDNTNMVWQFFSHLLVNCVDFPSMCAFRKQLPISEREIIIKPELSTKVESLLETLPQKTVFVHPGKHWESKTFPKWWWDKVLSHLLVAGITPIIIGADADDNRGTVNVETSGCLDLRNQLSITDSIYLLQRANVLLTNDSSPMHMAASHNPEDLTTGRTWIGFVATCKHPDHISHWRNGQWSWREVNHGRGGYWDLVDDLPNKAETFEVDKIDQETLISWLPEPAEYAKWAIEKSSSL